MVLQLDLKLGESPNGNFWHKYPKVMWDNGEEIKKGLSNFFENENLIFLRFAAPEIGPFFDFCQTGLTSSFEVRFHFFTPFSETRDRARAS